MCEMFYIGKLFLELAIVGFQTHAVVFLAKSYYIYIYMYIYIYVYGFKCSLKLFSSAAFLSSMAGRAVKRRRTDLVTFWNAFDLVRSVLTGGLAWKINNDRQARHDNRALHFASMDAAFARDHARTHKSSASADGRTPAEVAFETWCRFGSWARCMDCKVLYPLKLNQRSLDQPDLAPVDGCCGECHKPGCYVTPQLEDIPMELRNLTVSDIRNLRPMTLHHEFTRKSDIGYRKHSQRLKLRWKDQHHCSISNYAVFYIV